MKAIADWLQTKWSRAPRDAALIHAYGATFQSPEGRRVLRDLMDHVYCTVYEGSDPLQLAFHNGRRSVVHELLENLDQAEAPMKYHQAVEA